MVTWFGLSPFTVSLIRRGSGVGRHPQTRVVRRRGSGSDSRAQGAWVGRDGRRRSPVCPAAAPDITRAEPPECADPPPPGRCGRRRRRAPAAAPAVSRASWTRCSCSSPARAEGRRDGTRRRACKGSRGAVREGRPRANGTFPPANGCCERLRLRWTAHREGLALWVSRAAAVPAEAGTAPEWLVSPRACTEAEALRGDA